MTKSKNELTLESAKKLNIIEKYLTIWVGLCIVGGIILGPAGSRRGRVTGQDGDLFPWRPDCFDTHRHRFVLHDVPDRSQDRLR